MDIKRTLGIIIMVLAQLGRFSMFTDTELFNAFFDTGASFLDLDLSITSGIVSSKINEK